MTYSKLIRYSGINLDVAFALTSSLLLFIISYNKIHRPSEEAGFTIVSYADPTDVGISHYAIMLTSVVSWVWVRD